MIDILTCVYAINRCDPVYVALNYSTPVGGSEGALVPLIFEALLIMSKMQLDYTSKFSMFHALNVNFSVSRFHICKDKSCRGGNCTEVVIPLAIQLVSTLDDGTPIFRFERQVDMTKPPRSD